MTMLIPSASPLLQCSLTEAQDESVYLVSDNTSPINQQNVGERCQSHGDASHSRLQAVLTQWTLGGLRLTAEPYASIAVSKQPHESHREL